MEAMDSSLEGNLLQNNQSETASHHTREQSKNKLEADKPSQISLPELRQLFGGQEENVQYYLALREAVMRSREKGEICWCDPRDGRMREGIEHSQWKPKVVLKPLDPFEGLCEDELGFSSQQTAQELTTEARIAEIGDIGSKEEVKNEAGVASESQSFTCGINGCSQRFSSLANYESHYHTCHNFVCATCKRRFVSNFLLDIHLQENHDSYFQILSPRVDMYCCLVESCEQKFRTAELRKDHLIVQHKYPANFSFHQPIKPKATKSNVAGSSVGKDNSMEVVPCEDPYPSLAAQRATEPTASAPAEGSSMETEAPRADTKPRQTKTRGERRRRSQGNSQGRGAKVPTTICFGRGSQRAFQRRGGKGQHWHQRFGMDVDTTVDIEKVDFEDMVQSLPDCA